MTAVQGPSPTLFIEHVNLTVRDIDRAIAFLQAALPAWRVRGGGRMEWHGKTIRWVHVGDEAQYIALQSDGEGPGTVDQPHATGAKHVGIVVPSVDEVVQRLAAAGFPLDHWGGKTARRNSAYLMEGDDIQFEFVEYATANLAERAEYAQSYAQ